MIAPDDELVLILSRRSRAHRDALAVGRVGQPVGAAALDSRDHQVVNRVVKRSDEAVVLGQPQRPDRVDHGVVLDVGSLA